MSDKSWIVECNDVFPSGIEWHYVIYDDGKAAYDDACQTWPEFAITLFEVEDYSPETGTASRWMPLEAQARRDDNEIWYATLELPE